jgi:hypothetical protein
VFTFFVVRGGEMRGFLRIVHRHRDFLVGLSFTLGGILLSAQSAFADVTFPGGKVGPDVSAINEMSCWLLYFQEGTYGALLLVVSGVGALVSFALGGYRTALNCLIVAIASLMIRPVAELMFDYSLDCSALKAPTPPASGNTGVTM